MDTAESQSPGSAQQDPYQMSLPPIGMREGPQGNPREGVLDEDRPIIMGPWSMRRIFAGAKTETRRIVKPQPPTDYEWALDLPPRFCDEETTGFLEHGPGWYYRSQVSVDKARWRVVGGSRGCPYGEPGSEEVDTLWVREAFRLPEHVDGEHRPKEYAGVEGPNLFPHVRYEADGAWSNSLEARSSEPEWGRKRPPIHMPKELCRLRLRVKDVQVERVQEITHSGRRAEGIEVRGPDHMNPGTATMQRFRSRWTRLNGDRAWTDDPFVWVVSFSLITK